MDNLNFTGNRIRYFKTSFLLISKRQMGWNKFGMVFLLQMMNGVIADISYILDVRKIFHEVLNDDNMNRILSLKHDSL